MKALKYTGLNPKQHTLIYDARDTLVGWFTMCHVDGAICECGRPPERPCPGFRYVPASRDEAGARHYTFTGSPLRIDCDEIVPLDRFQHSSKHSWSANVIEEHLRCGLAVMVDVPESPARESAATAATDTEDDDGKN